MSPSINPLFASYLLIIGNLYALTPETIVEEVRQLSKG